MAPFFSGVRSRFLLILVKTRICPMYCGTDHGGYGQNSLLVIRTFCLQDNAEISNLC